MTNRIKIKLNADLNGYKKNAVVELSCDEEGIPYNPFWRRRLLDADYDNCIEIVKEQPVKTDKKPTIKQGE